jgi:hypothetical protein
MAITTAFCTSAKQDLLEAVTNLNSTGGHTIKMALYTSSATLSAATTAYSATNEASGTGYSAGGNTLTNSGVATSGTTGYADFADTSWSTATITARGCLIYNSSASNASISSHDFGSDKSSTGGTFTVQFPAADATNAIIRLA